MNKEEARRFVEEHLRQEPLSHVLVILDEKTIERDSCWVFFYTSRKFLETRDVRDLLLGNGPILVSNKTGKLHFAGTSFPAEYYIENFEKYGSVDGPEK